MRIPSAFLVLLLVGCAAATTDEERRLAVDEASLVPVELASVAIVPLTGTPVVLLRDPDQGRTVPIFIGAEQAHAIVIAQRGIATPRPMTHDLTVNLLDAMGGRLERVIVDELRDGTYFGALEIKTADSTVLVDTRPSDGLALAVRTGARILVAPAVLEAGADIPYRSLGGDDVVTALGITVMPAQAEVREALGLPDQPGVLVSSVRGLAGAAGIQPGALIVAVNGIPPDSPLAFLDLVNATERGAQTSLRFWLNGDFSVVELPTDLATPPAQRRDSL
ncbi:MAG: bifunctional nuclease domain-containing protein [Wenzhouxiangella sp.]|jgi:bifunctional DNase/RNase|nr:bifunctional nuclease domain-containing protein [Wenzhouxiangella sp.]